MSAAYFTFNLSTVKRLNVPLLIQTSALLQSSASCGKQNAHQNRKFHLTNRNSSSQTRNFVRVGTSTVPVKHYGQLLLNNPAVNLAIKPINIDEYPNMDTATCSFFSENSTEVEFPVFSQNDDKLSLISSKMSGSSKNECVVEIPIKYDISVKDPKGKNDVSIQSMESSLIEILTESGNITSKSLKGDVINISSRSGNIDCQGVTQGNVNFQSESGNIHGHRFAGPSCKITTSSGNISTASIYSDVSQFSTQEGNVSLKNLHRQCSVTIKGNGNLTITGMDGSLNAILGKGSHQIQISQLQDHSSLKIENGALTLKVPELCPFGIRIRAKSLTLPEPMKKPATMLKGENGHTVFEYNLEQSSVIDIDAENSQVVVQNENWLASLGLIFS